MKRAQTRTRVVGASALVALVFTAPIALDSRDAAADGHTGAPSSARAQGSGLTRYPSTARHSPLTRSVADHLREVADRRPRLHENRFSKIGASATVNRNFMRCFATEHVRWGDHEDLRDTAEFFNAAPIGQSRTRRGRRSPFQRRSLAARVGWSAVHAVRGGSRSPLAREVRGSHGRYALVMYGTNDMERGRPTRYARAMRRIVSMLETRGVIPILSTVMPRDDDAQSDRWVPLYNTIIRAVGQTHRVPVMNYHGALVALPDHGLASDRLHPNVLFAGPRRPRGCDFRAVGLRHGYNQRNLLAIEALTRARRARDEAFEPEPAPAQLQGAGSWRRPYSVRALPFADGRVIERAPAHRRTYYRRCGGRREFPGNEYVYRFRLSEPAEVYAVVSGPRASGLGVHILAGSDSRGPCVGGGGQTARARLRAGEYRLVVDRTEADRTVHADRRFVLALARIDRPSTP